MPDRDEEQFTVNPVRRSLIRPDLMMGGDKLLMTLLMGMCLILLFPLGIGAGSLPAAISVVPLFFIGRKALGVLAKKEPYIVPIFQSSLNHRILYSATGGRARADRTKRFSS